MKVLLDENGYVRSYAFIGDLDGSIEVIDTDFEEISKEQFQKEYRSYRLVDNKLVKDETKLDEVALSDKKQLLRQYRDSQCFSVINRGILWYNTLTDAQKAELNEWYHAWLDVTETLVVPEKPDWLE